jgi:hypothetical protein
VEARPVEGNSRAETSVTVLQQLRAHHPAGGVWDNAPAPGGAPLRDYLRLPDRRLRLVRVPAYSPAVNADEHIWAWVRQEVTATTCFGTADTVRAQRSLLRRTGDADGGGQAALPDRVAAPG